MATINEVTDNGRFIRTIAIEGDTYRYVEVDPNASSDDQDMFHGGKVLQAVVDAIPEANDTRPFYIHLKDGVYFETLFLTQDLASAGDRLIVFKGDSSEGTIIRNSVTNALSVIHTGSNSNTLKLKFEDIAFESPDSIVTAFIATIIAGGIEVEFKNCRLNVPGSAARPLNCTTDADSFVKVTFLGDSPEQALIFGRNDVDGLFQLVNVESFMHFKNCKFIPNDTVAVPVYIWEVLNGAYIIFEDTQNVGPGDSVHQIQGDATGTAGAVHFLGQNVQETGIPGNPFTVLSNGGTRPAIHGAHVTISKQIDISGASTTPVVMLPGADSAILESVSIGSLSGTTATTTVDVETSAGVNYMTTRTLDNPVIAAGAAGIQFLAFDEAANAEQVSLGEFMVVTVAGAFAAETITLNFNLIYMNHRDIS